jgi:hypothetical protein
MRVSLVLFLAAASLISNSRSASLPSCNETTLRAAVSGGGTVTFDCDGKIPLSQTLQVTNDVVIDATGHQVTISGSNAVRVFAVSPGTKLTLINLTIADGRQRGTNGSSSSFAGESVSAAAILNLQGTVSLAGCVLSNNVIWGGNGSGNPATNGNGGQARGGAIFNDRGILEASNCVFIANGVVGGTGGFLGPFAPSSVGGEGSGGAIYNKGGEVSLASTILSFNSATGGMAGGAISVPGYGSAGDGLGGAFSSSGGLVTVADCRFEANSAVGNNLPWNGGLTGKGVGGAINIATGSLTATRTIFQKNVALGGVKARIGAPGEGCGGAICSQGTVQLIECLFSLNRVSTGVAGSIGGDGKGGGVCNLGALEISGCTFATNSAVGGNAFGIGPPGSTGRGGSGAGGGLYSSTSFQITNSTFFGNVAAGGSATFGGSGTGGGICALSNGLAVNVTIVSNAAAGGGAYAPEYIGPTLGAGICATNQAVSIGNSILANSGSGSNCFGSLADLGGNISSDGSCNFSTSLNNTEPVLGPLADYGGPTPTIALLEGSPAIDGGVDDLGPGSEIIPKTDQRGHTRPFGTHVDSGAFESSPPYLIRGRVRRYLEPGLRVTAGKSSAAVQANGDYSIEGLPSGFPTVTLEGSKSVSVPQSQTMVVGPDRFNVDFDAYLLNGFWIEPPSNNLIRIVFAGENGQTERVESSVDLQNWAPHSTNIVGPNRLFELYLPNPSTGESKALRAVRLQ